MINSFGFQENKVSLSLLLTGCQVLLWDKPIKSCQNQSVQLYTKTVLEIGIDFSLSLNINEEIKSRSRENNPADPNCLDNQAGGHFVAWK